MSYKFDFIKFIKHCFVVIAYFIICFLYKFNVLPNLKFALNLHFSTLKSNKNAILFY
ncbi:hypothetical protein UNSW1_120 [Campylobacter concisus UNSW1]|nr:hypothetical protein UNSW1_120 [Campylobacter concisus UNSW1]